MMKMRRRGTGLALAFVAAALAWACGGSIDDEAGPGIGASEDASADRAGMDATDDGGASTDGGRDDAPHDANADVTRDGADPDAPSCIGPCLPGESACLDGQLVTCAKDTLGCNVWSAPVACGSLHVCASKLHTASCVCQPGTLPSGSSCVLALSPPRPLAPLSTSTATSRSPALHWELAPSTDGAKVEICHDRPCTQVEATFTVLGSSAAPPSPLAPGVHFWRLFATSSGTVGTDPSPVWQMNVGARTAPHDTSFGTNPDVDGDGYADVVVGTVTSGGNADYFVYPGGAGGLSLSPTVVHGPTTGYGSFHLRSVRVASAGDVDGDGYGDIVTSTLGDNANGANVAILHVYLGGVAGLSSTSIDLVSQGGGYSAIAVAPAGDVNGDGYADIIATSSTYTADAYVFLGGPGGPSAVPFTITEPRDMSTSVAGVGDVNGDGYGDVLVSAHMYNGAQWTTFLHLGGPSGPSSAPLIVPSSIASAAGDVNGDGLADIFGAGSIYYGDATNGLVLTPVPLPAGGKGVVTPVAPAGDVNGDGYGDLLGGVPGSSPGAGHAYVFFGSATGLSGPPSQVAGSASFGGDVSGAGDVDGDGFFDVLVGALQDGSVMLLPGSASGLSNTPVVLQTFASYGFALLELGPRRRPRG